MKKTDKKILVTGGAGYIGCVLTNTLVKKGYSVRILDTFYWGKDVLKNHRNRVEIIQADIRNIESKVLKNVSSVIHLAALSNDPMADFNPSANFEINTYATAHFAKLCKRNGVNKFIFSSSASIYHKDPIKAGAIYDERSSVLPKAAYSLSKLQAETELLKLTDDNFSPVILRQGTVYGFSPRMRYDLVVNTMVKDVLSSGKISVYCEGKEWRPLIDITDIARAYIAVLKSSDQKIKGQIFNLVYKNFNILDLAKIIKRVIVTEEIANPKIIVDSRLRKARSYQISGEKIKKVLGWQPKMSVEDSVRHMLTKITSGEFANYNHPRFYNIEWMKLLVSVSDTLKKVKRVF